MTIYSRVPKKTTKKTTTKIMAVSCKRTMFLKVYLHVYLMPFQILICICDALCQKELTVWMTVCPEMTFICDAMVDASKDGNVRAILACL